MAIFPAVALVASRVFCLLLLCVLWAAPVSAQDRVTTVQLVDENRQLFRGGHNLVQEGDVLYFRIVYSVPVRNQTPGAFVLTLFQNNSAHRDELRFEDLAGSDGVCAQPLMENADNFVLNTPDAVPYGPSVSVVYLSTPMRICSDFRAEGNETFVIQFRQNLGNDYETNDGVTRPAAQPIMASVLNFQPTTITVIASNRGSVANAVSGGSYAEGVEGGVAIRTLDLTPRTDTAMVGFTVDFDRSTAGVDDFTIPPGTDSNGAVVSYNRGSNMGTISIPANIGAADIPVRVTNDIAPETAETIMLRLISHEIGTGDDNEREFQLRPVTITIPANDAYTASIDAAGLPTGNQDEGDTFTIRINLTADVQNGNDSLGLIFSADTTDGNEWEVAGPVRLINRAGTIIARPTAITDRTNLRTVCPSGSTTNCNLGFTLSAGTAAAEVDLRIRDDDTTETAEEELGIRLAYVSMGHSYARDTHTVTINPSDQMLPGQPTVTTRQPARAEQENATVTLISTAAYPESEAPITLTYTWEQVLSPGDTPVTLDISTTTTRKNRVESRAVFTAPMVAVQEQLTFRPIVTAQRRHYTDVRREVPQFIIYVTDTQAPTANPGSNFGPFQESTMTILYGSGSDPDNDPGLTYQWRQTDPAPTPGNPSVTFGRRRRLA